MVGNPSFEYFLLLGLERRGSSARSCTCEIAGLDFFCKFLFCGLYALLSCCGKAEVGGGARHIPRHKGKCCSPLLTGKKSHVLKSYSFLHSSYLFVDCLSEIGSPSLSHPKTQKIADSMTEHLRLYECSSHFKVEALVNSLPIPFLSH